jgi:hypothetical protein
MRLTGVDCPASLCTGDMRVTFEIPAADHRSDGAASMPHGNGASETAMSTRPSPIQS